MLAGDVIVAEAAPEPEADGAVRTRSVWASQLLLAAVVVVVALIVQALAPAQFTTWQFSSGVAAIVVITAASLAIPWHRLPRNAILVLPLLDILAIGLIEHGGDIATSFLWVFPVVWISTHFRMAAMLTAGGLICLIMLVNAVVRANDEAAVARMLVVLLSLTFLAISTHLATRQTRAFQTLLRRQAGKLQETVTNVRTAEQRVRFLLDSVDLGIVRVGDDGRILTVNETYASMYGIDPEQPSEPGTSVEYTALRGEPLPPERRPLARAAACERIEEELVWLFDAEGTWRALEVTVRPLPPTPRERASSLLMVREVTALVESQQARDRIATLVSHELRNPLTAVLGHAEILVEDTSLPPRVREQLQVIESASHRMQHLIEEILARPQDAVAAQAGRAAIDLMPVVAASVDSFRPTAEAAGVEVRVDAPERLPVVGDAFRLRQVVDNLLSNAIKYTPRGGVVMIRGAAEAERVRLEIVDTGIGIAPEDLPRVFEPYFRAQSARASGAAGTGLGMGIARSIVESHGGRLELSSQPGVGTTASIVLPAGAERA